MKRFFATSLSILIAIISADAQVSLAPVSQYTLTPNTNHIDCISCWIFYHPSGNKFYVTYAARQFNSCLPAGIMQNYRRQAYDSAMQAEFETAEYPFAA